MSALIANIATSTLNGAIDAVQTAISIQAADAALFPSPTAGDWFPLVLGNGAAQEIVKVTARAAGALTVVRGQEGTSAAAWPNSTFADLRLTAAALLALPGMPAAILTTRGDLIRRGAAVPERLPLGASGRVVQSDGADAVFDLLRAGAFATGPGIVTPAMLDNGAAVSVVGRSANSAGARADIAAGANDRLFRRVSDVLDFGTLTAGMVPASLITYAMLASAALATNVEMLSGTASKLLSAAILKSAVAYQTLVDAATIAWDMSLGNNGQVVLGANRTLGNPTNATAQFGFVLKVTASGATRTLALSSQCFPATGIEAFPISIATTETVFLFGFVDTTSRFIITGVLRT